MKKTNAMQRYALYFAPAPSTALDELGRTWLGRDSRTGEELEPELLPAQMERQRWYAATEAPRRYGFHATLKPPFRLAEHATLEELDEMLKRFTSERETFELPPLKVSRLGAFLALILSQPCAELHQLAADCVTEFDSFREAPDPADVARRMTSTHTSAERENLLRWGYPYVLDTWKFHMTLTGSLTPELLEEFDQHLRGRFGDVCVETQTFDSICLFEEPEPRAPMLLKRSYPLCR